MRMFAHVIDAENDVNRRRTARRALMLDSVAQQDAIALSDIVIQNLSQTGLLMESGAEFSVGEIFYLHLPEMGATPAQVRWTESGRYGCEFLTPVSKAVISAAVLKSAFDLKEEEVEAFTAPQPMPQRFFADQALPADQRGGLAVYAASAAMAAMAVAVAAVMASGQLVIS